MDAVATQADQTRKWVAVQSRNPKFPREWDVYEGGATGYSVIGNGFIEETQAKQIASSHNESLKKIDINNSLSVNDEWHLISDLPSLEDFEPTGCIEYAYQCSGQWYCISIGEPLWNLSPPKHGNWRRITPPIYLSGSSIIATSYQLVSEFESHEIRHVTFDRMNSPDYQGEKWAVRRSGSVLAKAGEFEYEPMPSNRDDDFYSRCRFDSLTEAINAYEKWKGLCLTA